MAGATAPAGGFRQSLAQAARRLSSPLIYLAVLGSLQIVVLWQLRSLYGLVIVLLTAAVLIALLFSLAWVKERWRSKLAGVVLLSLLSSVVPTVLGMIRRSEVGISFEHDGLLQVESAIDRLLKGEAIYGVDWSNTPMGSLAWNMPGPNPALHHLAYFPLTVLVGVPFRLLAGGLHAAFDYRVVVLTFVLLGISAILCLPIPPRARIMVMTGVFINPLVTLYLWTGRNDVEFLAVVFLALALLARGRSTTAGLALGVAVALKPFAWPAVPFFLLVIFLRWRSRRSRMEVRLAVGALAAIPLLTILPFLLSNVGAFFTDTVLYTSGGVTDAYPIGGYGFGALLLRGGVIAHETDAFPFAAIQVALMAPLLYLTGAAFLRRATLSRWMAGYALALLAFTFFARFFNDNYVGVVIALFLCIRPLGDRLLVIENSFGRERLAA